MRYITCRNADFTACYQIGNTDFQGGADGPTSIFIAGKVGSPLYAAIVVGAVMLIAGLLLLLKKKK